MTAPPPLTPEQQQLLDQYQQATRAYWQVHDVYAQALRAMRRNQRACLAAGFSPASYPGF